MKCLSMKQEDMGLAPQSPCKGSMGCHVVLGWGAVEPSRFPGLAGWPVQPSTNLLVQWQTVPEFNLNTDKRYLTSNSSLFLPMNTCACALTQIYTHKHLHYMNTFTFKNQYCFILSPEYYCIRNCIYQFLSAWKSINTVQGKRTSLMKMRSS